MTREEPPGTVDGDGRSCDSWTLMASPTCSTAGNSFLLIESLLLINGQGFCEEGKKVQAWGAPIRNLFFPQVP